MKRLSKLFLPAIVALVLVSSPSVGIAQTTDADVQDALNKVRQSRQEFKDSKTQETNEAAEAGRAQGQAQRDAAQQRREAAQLKMEDKRKETLTRLVDLQVKHLERTKERVERMPNITDTLKTQLATEIDADIVTLNNKKTEIDAAEGRDAIRALAQEIRDFFKSYRDRVRSIVDAILASRADLAAAKAEARAADIDEKVQELKGEGKDTTELEEELDEAEQDIDDAQEAIGKKAFREANEDLKGAYQKFRSIAEKAKGL